MTGAAIGMIAIAPPLAAQDAQAPGEQIDILAPQEDYLGPLEDCSAEQEAASISGEIVVCRRRRDNGGEVRRRLGRVRERRAEIRASAARGGG